jgi:glycogen(starch) synthase
MADHVSRVFDVPGGRISTIANGVDQLDLVSAPPDALPALRARYAEPDERLVLMIGRLVHEKGFHLALEALTPLVREPGRVRFVVAGSGMAEPELTSQASTLGLDRHGSFIGWAGEDLVHSLYRVADITIVPSLYEPFGLVALEAMASGCVCVVADTGGLREVVPEDGSVAVRFRSGDSAALTSVLRRLLADDALRAQISGRARSHALQFSWPRSAGETMGIYQTLTESRVGL